MSHDPSLLPTFNTGCGATTGSTSSAPGAERIRNIQLRSGPRHTAADENQALAVVAMLIGELHGHTATK